MIDQALCLQLADLNFRNQLYNYSTISSPTLIYHGDENMPLAKFSSPFFFLLFFPSIFSFFFSIFLFTRIRYVVHSLRWHYFIELLHFLSNVFGHFFPPKSWPYMHFVWFLKTSNPTIGLLEKDGDGRETSNSLEDTHVS